MSRGLAPETVAVAKEVLRTGEGNPGLALLALLADEQLRTHRHRWRDPLPKDDVLVEYVAKFCPSCRGKKGHDGSVWWG